jgi:hypothetical protein
MFQEYDVVTLKRAVPDVPVPAGAAGTVLHVHDATPPVYVVEFAGEGGKPLGGDVFDIKHDDLELKIAHKDMPGAK